jgi:hypothetical protein
MMDGSHSGECAVPVYRFYIFEINGHVAGPPTFYELPNDDAALEEAKKILNDRAIEIWRGVNKVGRTRKIGRLDPVVLTKVF